MPTSSNFDRTSPLLYVVVACAVVITGLRVRDSFLMRAAVAESHSAGREPVYIEGWGQIAETGHRMGSESAPVTIVEFVDFECPVCRMFTLGALSAIRERYPRDVAVVFRHWPLPYHRFACPSARAAECAAQQGRFSEYHDALFRAQDSLGLKSFTAFAREAGVTDTLAFIECTNQSGPVEAIDVDSAAAQRLGATGTPAIVINGLLLTGAPDTEKLDSLVREALRNPTSARGIRSD